MPFVCRSTGSARWVEISIMASEIRAGAPLLWLASASALALLGTSAMAQTASPGDTAQAQDNLPANSVTPKPTGGEKASPDAEIVVTGTRIRRLDFSSPSPIVSLDAKTIQQSGTTNLTDFLTGYPALIGSSTSNQNAGDQAGIGTTGLNLLNLRNLGTQRTLVLIDGRRQVAGLAGEQAVDINTIPQDLVDSVDVLTGGASAIYGADGVTGVVNFRLKQNFEGLSARVQGGTSGHGDSGQRLGTITVGKNFAEGRGNIALSYEYGAEDRLLATDRKRLSGTNRQVFVQNPDDGHTSATDDPNIPDYVPERDIRYGLSSRNGAVDIDGDYVPEFTGTGAIYDNGADRGQGFVQGGSSTLVADYDNDLLPRIRRNIFNGIGHFDVSDKLTLYAEAKYAQTNSFSLGQPTFDYGIFIEPDNPYLPANIRAAINPEVGGVLVNRDNLDLGQRGEDIRRRTIRTVIGGRGDLSDSLHYDLSYVYGQTKIRDRFVNDIYNDRFFAAIDAVRDNATGAITCRANLDPDWEPNQPYESGRPVTPRTTFGQGDCSPINILGEGQNAAGLAFINAPTVEHSTIRQQVVSGAISGDFRHLFTLPGGPVGFALGGEYRKEQSRFDPDQIEQQGLSYSNLLLPTTGKFHVKEYFGELNAPIAKDVRFIKALEVGAAIRISDYSTIGKTTTWKVDGRYAPVQDITFRGTYSVAIRAPNISELFAPKSQTFAFFDDPCNSFNQGNGTASRKANCTALLSSLGVTDPSTFEDTRSFSIAGLSGGNTSLRQEKAKTWTAGVVLTPRFVPGLTVSADWYDIRLNNAINTVDPDQLAQLCVDQPTTANQFCANIVRQNGGANAGLITSFVVVPQNVAVFRTAGLDVNFNYRLQTAKLGSFNLKVVAGYLDRLSFVGTPGADPTDERGTAIGAGLSTTPAPKYQANLDLTWANGPFTFNYGLSWFDKTLRQDKLTAAAQPDYYASKYFYFKERWVHDIYASVDVQKNFQFYFGVNNVFDQKPDVGASSYPVDSVGRYFFAGARVKTDKLF